MAASTPHFRARLRFTFREHGPERRHWFRFEGGLHRRVPIRMEGVEGLHTLDMSSDQAGDFREGDELEVNCSLLWPEGFERVAGPGVRFELWDAGFFAEGVILELFTASWKTAIQSSRTDLIE